MKKRLFCFTLTLTLILSCISLSSCSLASLLLNGGVADGGQKDEGSGNGTTVGDIYVEGGDTNNITINSTLDGNLLAASKAILSVVSIYAEFERSYTSGWGSGYNSTEPFAQSGAGVIYKLDKENGNAYIITNYHVIHSSKDNSEKQIARKINLYLYGMEASEYAIPAEFVGGSMQYDLAVLKVTASTVLMSSIATEVTVADSNDVSVLDTAIAIGNPDTSGISATAGYISVDSEEIELLASDDKTTIKIRVMRTDTAINGGNSGGGLFNSKGELIGIVNAKKTVSDGMGYAIPSNVAKYIAENILYYCNGNDKTSVQRCLLGITVTPNELYTVYDAETGRVHRCERVMVSSVNAGSLAEGYFKEGDIINSITVDGISYEVTRLFHVVDSMLNARVGSTVVFNVERNGTEISLTITVTEDTLTEYK